MNLKYQRKVAARMLKCGIDKVWIEPGRQKEISEAITRADLRNLIKKGYIRKKPCTGQSKWRARKKKMQKRKGKRKGHGSRKGGIKSRLHPKRSWISSVRSLRGLLKKLKTEKKITTEIHRKLYKMVKGGVFRSKKHLELYLKEHNYITEDIVEKKMPKKPQATRKKKPIKGKKKETKKPEEKV